VTSVPRDGPEVAGGSSNRRDRPNVQRHLERDDVPDEKYQANHAYRYDRQTNVTEPEWPNEAFEACNF
jgi:hypothetical protein